MGLNRQPLRLFITMLALITMISLVTGCSLPLVPTSTQVTPTSPIPVLPSPTPYPVADIAFYAEIPVNSIPGRGVFINLLDEVTGLALNPSSYKMNQVDARHFYIHLPIPVGSVVKYRYTLEGTPPLIEYTTSGTPVRYRMYFASTPGSVQDVISAWENSAYSGPSGRINGLVIDSTNQKPIPNLLVIAGGVQTITAADGTFLLEGLPTGTHNVVIYAMDGSYETFQQGALVAPDSSTPANISLKPSTLVNVSFVVSIPPGSVKGVPVRIAGNLSTLGNTYADLRGGLSTIASRMPVLQLLPDGRYAIALRLPARADIRYKYTLGDGFWNTEQTADGKFNIRQLIVPDNDTVIQDVVSTWQSGNSAPIAFQVTVPSSTLPYDTVSIQFNPYGWTEPLPMWSIGNNSWLYILYSPLQILGNIGYRYCRNDQCGSADDMNTMGDQSHGYPFSTSLINQTFQDTVSAWAWFKPVSTPTTITAADIQSRGDQFVAGVEFQPYYHPSWQSRYLPALLNIHDIGANWVFFTPTWTSTRNSPPKFEPVPENNILWPDSLDFINNAHSIQSKVAIFPSVQFQTSSDSWWKDGKRDFAWWQSWFEQYKIFALHHADLAAQSGAQAIVLGGDWVTPAMPFGKLSDGTASGVPADAETRWREIIKSVRDHYSGTIIWALPYTDGITPPAFLDAVDDIYILWDTSLSSNTNPSPAELETEINNRLNKDIKPIRDQFNKPLIIGVSYPSAGGSATNCLPGQQGNGCLDLRLLDRPNPDLPAISIDLAGQENIYSAFFSAINQQSWVDGFVSRDYYPPAVLQDKSGSVHGKPAADILWYWFPRLLGTTK